MRKVLSKDLSKLPPLNVYPEEIKSLIMPSFRHIYAVPYTLYRNFVIKFKSPVRAILK